MASPTSVCERAQGQGGVDGVATIAHLDSLVNSRSALSGLMSVGSDSLAGTSDKSASVSESANLIAMEEGSSSGPGVLPQNPNLVPGAMGSLGSRLTVTYFLLPCTDGS